MWPLVGVKVPEWVLELAGVAVALLALFGFGYYMGMSGCEENFKAQAARNNQRTAEELGKAGEKVKEEFDRKEAGRDDFREQITRKANEYGKKSPPTPAAPAGCPAPYSGISAGGLRLIGDAIDGRFSQAERPGPEALQEAGKAGGRQ